MKFRPQWRIRRPADDTQTVYISEKFGVRSLHIGSDTVQSAMRLSRPYDLELAYTRSMMAFLLFLHDPRDVLMIGLGGGSVAKFMHYRMPDLRIRAIEINPEVVAVAEASFGVPRDERLEVIVGDGAEHMAESGRPVDVLMVDGYDGEAQAEAVATRRFYDHCRARLTPRGLMVVNLWSGDRAYQDALLRIRAAFPAGVLCVPADKPGNVIALAFAESLPAVTWDALIERAGSLTARYGLDFARFVEVLRAQRPDASTGPF